MNEENEQNSNDSDNKNIETVEKDSEEMPAVSEQDKGAEEAVNSEEGKPDKDGETPQYDPKNIHYEGEIAVYTDPETGSQFQWDNNKNEWITKFVYGFEDDTHVYTDSDGTKYFWDKERSAWFPKVDDEFMAKYQMNYGFIDNTNINKKDEVQPKPDVKQRKEKTVTGEKRKASEPTWFDIDDSKNTSVYVSNLPLDINDEEFIELMQKAGLILRDVQTGKFKIKLYKDPGTEYLKGDALCTYIRVESVYLALNILDGYNYRDRKLKVERAHFQMKGEFNPTLKPKMKKKKEKLKFKKQQEKLFDWRPEKVLGERSKHERVVIVKNLFNPKVFDTEVSLILEYQQNLREECSKYGEVKKVIIYDRHPDGVAQINMGTPEEADQIVTVLNGKMFMKRELIVEIWDGKTKFKIAETDAEINERLNKWDEFLEGSEGRKDGAKTEGQKESTEKGQ